MHLDKPEVGPNPFDSSEAAKNNTKQYLAMVYVQMGESEDAVNILVDIMENGSLIQQKEARELLSKLRT